MNSRLMLACFLLDAVVIGAGILAWQQGFFSHEQMFRWHRASSGLPFVNHGGMWGDIILVSPAIAFLIDRYASQWSIHAIIVCSIIAIIGSMAMHGLYSSVGASAPLTLDCLTLPGGVRPAGVLHVMYMACAFAILLLFYFQTHDVSLQHIVTISSMLAAHLAIAVLQPTWHVHGKLNATAIATAIAAWLGLIVGSLCCHFQVTQRIFAK